MSLEHVASEAAKDYFQKKYPYARLQGVYTDREHKRYTKLVPWYNFLMAMSCIVGVCGLACCLFVVLGRLEGYLWRVLCPGAECFPAEMEMLIPAACFALALCIPVTTSVFLRVFFPLSAAKVLDFMNCVNGYDCESAGNGLIKWSGILGALSLVYVCFSGVALSQDHFYIKSFTTLPQWGAYRDIVQIVDYEYIGSKQDPTNATALHRYWMTTKGGKEIDISGGETLSACLNLLVIRSGKQITYLKAR